MKARLILWLVLSPFFGFSGNTLAGDSTCYGYKSATKHFACNVSPYNSGNCTWWAAYKRPDLAAIITGTGWHGGDWYEKLKAKGVPVGNEPVAFAIVEFSNPGHVAYVEQTYGDGSFEVSEMDAYGSNGFDDGVNYATYYSNGDGTYRRNSGSTRWTIKGFIYHKESCDPSKERCGIKSNGPIGWYPPFEHCEQASQWFKLYDIKSQTSRFEPATKSDCPLACYAN